MTTSIVVPWFSYDDIYEEAKKFLHKYNSGDNCPVPVEEILELKLGISIIGIPGLLDVLEVDGMCSKITTSIMRSNITTT